MAEKNDNDNHCALNDCNTGMTTGNIRDDDTPIEASGSHSHNGVPAVDENPSGSLDPSMRREENPFSFKKFLNQDPTNTKQNLRRENHSPGNSMCSDNGNQTYNLTGMDTNSKVINTNDMASVLPDFVQDHLVIEQCYLNGGLGTINMANLNLHNLPDLNVVYKRQNDFNENNSGDNSPNHHSTCPANNLPDFTSEVGQSSGRSDLQNDCSNAAVMPDFTVNTSDGASNSLDRGEFMCVRDNSIRMRSNQRNCRISDNNKTGGRMSSSPSVPLDLPSYDGGESSEQPIPFDLTVPAEDRSSSFRGIPSTETVSKSLPDFLSDGPIQNDRLGESIQLGDLVSSIHEGNDQRISPEAVSDVFERNRIQRELDMLRRQLSEKNRIIHLLDAEIQDLRARERREEMERERERMASSLEYSVRTQIESDLKQALKRASNAENALMQTRMENNRLRAKLAALKCENVDSEPVDSSDSRSKSQRIANELRIAASTAENSLRSLLTGINNLRMIATSVENMHDQNDKTDEIDDFCNNEDSPPGPAL